MHNQITVRRLAELLLKKNVKEVKIIDSGLTNINYKIILTCNKEFVIRIPGIGTEYLVNRSFEDDNLKKIEHLGINVNTLLFDSLNGIKITEYINNINKKSNPISFDDIIGKVLVKIKKIHNSNIIFKNTFNPFLLIESYAKTITDLGVNLNNDEINLLNSFYDKLGNLTSVIIPKLVPCHNDICIDNIIKTYDDEYYIIDWEYSGMNDPYWDLASISQEFDLTVNNDEKILESYFGSLNSIEYKKMHLLLLKATQNILWFLWAKIKTHFGDDLIEYSSLRYKKAKKQLLEVGNYTLSF